MTVAGRQPGSPRTTNARLEKRLGLLDVYAISIGAMVAPGIFLLPGIASAEAGPAVILAYVVAGVLAVPAMLSAAELSTAMPRAGGPYYFLDRALGPLVGTIGGLGMWAALMFKTAFALVGLSAYLGLVVDLPVMPAAVVLTVAFTALNVVGVRKTSVLQVVLVAILVVFLTGFSLAGLASLLGQAGEVGHRFRPLVPTGPEGIVTTTGIVFFSYAGLTQVASVAEEVRRPGRTIPAGMLLALASALAFYVVGVTVMVGFIEPGALGVDLTPVATVTRMLVPGAAGLAMVTVAAVAGFAATGNAGILAAARYPFAMARDHLLGERLARIGRFGTPTAAVVATGAVMAVTIVALDVEAIASLASAFILVVFGLLNVAVIVMRSSRIPAYDPSFRSPLYPYTQVAGIAATLVLVVEIGVLSILFTLGLGAGCLLWWRVWARHRAARHGAVYHWFERLGQRRDDGLDAELIGIVQEEGLREEDRFDEVVARAHVLDRAQDLTADEAVAVACHELADEMGVEAETILHRSRSHQQVVSGHAVLASALLDEPARPELAMVRCRSDADPSDDGRTSPLIAVFVVVGGRNSAGTVLRSLAQLAAHVESPAFAREWLAAADEQELKEVLLHDERFLSLRLWPGTAAEQLAGQRLRELDLPTGALIALIRRDGRMLVPDGDTHLEVDDRLTVVGEPRAVDEIAQRYGFPAG